MSRSWSNSAAELWDLSALLSHPLARTQFRHRAGPPWTANPLALSHRAPPDLRRHLLIVSGFLLAHLCRLTCKNGLHSRNPLMQFLVRVGYDIVGIASTEAMAARAFGYDNGMAHHHIRLLDKTHSHGVQLRVSNHTTRLWRTRTMSTVWRSLTRAGPEEERNDAERHRISD